MRLLVNIDVEDIDEAVRFYTEGLTLRVGRKLDATWVELLGAEVPIYLLGAQSGTPPFPGSSGRDYRRHWTPVHLDFVVDDLEASLERAERAGAKVESQITTHAWGRMVLLADPFGNGFCLLDLTGRGYDAIA